VTLAGEPLRIAVITRTTAPLANRRSASITIITTTEATLLGVRTPTSTTIIIPTGVTAPASITIIIPGVTVPAIALSTSLSLPTTLDGFLGGKRVKEEPHGG